MTVQEAARHLQMDEFMAEFLVKEFSLATQGGHLDEEGVRVLGVLRYLLLEEGYTLRGARAVLPRFLEKMADPDATLREMERRVEQARRVIHEATDTIEAIISFIDSHLGR